MHGREEAGGGRMRWHRAQPTCSSSTPLPLLPTSHLFTTMWCISRSSRPSGEWAGRAGGGRFAACGSRHHREGQQHGLMPQCHDPLPPLCSNIAGRTPDAGAVPARHACMHTSKRSKARTRCIKAQVQVHKGGAGGHCNALAAPLLWHHAGGQQLHGVPCACVCGGGGGRGADVRT